MASFVIGSAARALSTTSLLWLASAPHRNGTSTIPQPQGHAPTGSGSNTVAWISGQMKTLTTYALPITYWSGKT
ncbi:hypothetical protein C8Q76DRAFT_755112 [Earliella scabrosa]|nr:hypothetical protein C8Q76DRAFT_755112 [Earliella scabrosa]